MATKRSSSPKKKRLLISDVCQRYLRHTEVTKELGTLTSYRYRVGVLVQLLADLCQVQYLDEVDTDHLRQCVKHLQATNLGEVVGARKVAAGRGRGHAFEDGSTYTVESVRGFIRVWKAFFSWCLQEGLVQINPADARFKAPRPEDKVKATFTEEQIYKMLDVFDRSEPLGFRNYVMLVLLLDTGMRLSELEGLQFKDVHETYVKVYGKGRKEREIGISPETSTLIWKYTSQYRIPKDETVGALFLTRSGTGVADSTIKSVVARVKQETGLIDIQVSPHVFRHTFSKMYLENGGDVFKLSRELGHSSVQVTEMYLKDFGSTQARKEHTSRSPLAKLNLKKQHNKKRIK
jgi:integrase/recombinase XerD